MSTSLASCCRPLLQLFAVLSVIVFHAHDIAGAGTLVSGRYLSASSTDIVLNLVIQNPAPANLIVEQYLSPENSIVDTSPQAKKVDAAQASAKWLFLNTRSGNLTLTIRLNEPLRGSVRAIVRYRAPNDGSFTELRITP